jgi:hypothetical protein
MALVSRPSPLVRALRLLALIALTTALFIFGLALTVISVTE